MRNRTKHRRRARVTGAVIAALMLGGSLEALADATAGGGGVSQVDQFSGSLTHSIHLDVPAFHGIEPNLSIAYDSAGGAGWLGVGWSLGGIPVIERVSPNGGTAMFDNAVDGFRLGGVPLVPCKAGSKSPSCLAGGTHSSKIETYQRITYDAASDVFRVWERDGKRLTFSQVYWAGPLTSPTYQYGLTEVRDTHDNVVNYTWGQNLGNTCCWAYPKAISYNQTTITLDWTVRSDVETRGIGFGIQSMYGRLAAVEVTTSGQKVRAYALGYTQAASSRAGAAGRSLLTSVQQAGSDYALDAGYHFTGGTLLPAETFDYADTPFSDYAAHSLPDAQLGSGEATNPGAFQSGDIDGDGRADVIHIPPSQNTIFVHKGNADGTLSAAQTFPIRADQGDFTDKGQFLVVDLNADGKSDIVHLNGPWGTGYLNNGSGFDYYPGLYQSTWTANSNEPTTIMTLPMDIDGDGGTNLVNLNWLGGYVDPNWVNVNQVTSFRLMPGQSPAWSPTVVNLPKSYAIVSNGVKVGTFVSGDVNGDAYTDLVYVAGGSVTVLLNNGPAGPLGFTARPAVSGGISPNTAQQHILTGDFNGDGKTDLLTIPIQFAPVPIQAWLSTGNGSFSQTSPFTLTPTYGTVGADHFYTADVNGDGKTDVVHALGGVIYTWISNGDGTFTWSAKNGLDNVDNLDATTTGDFNGDGKGDVAFLSLRNLVALDANGSVGELMTAVHNGYGGTASFTYAPSTAYPHAGTASNFTSTNPGAAFGSGPVAMPNPGIVQTLQWITLSDVYGNGRTDAYSYDGALYDPRDRAFLGFRFVRHSSSWNAGENFGPFDDTYYHQGYGFVSKPEWELHYDGLTGRMLHASYHHWVSGTTDGSGNAAVAPYTQLEADTWTWDYDPQGSGAFRATCQQRAYDGWGNVQDEIDWGEVTAPAASVNAPPSIALSASGDETRTWTSHALNTSAFITSLPSGQETFAGTSFVGTSIALSSFLYDGLPSGQVSAGNRTSEGHWLDTANAMIVSSASYDAYGNVVQTVRPIDAATSAVTNVAYDATYHLFPVSRTDALGHVSTMAYTPICGQPTQEVDPNGHAATTAYDALCRPATRVEGDGGTTTTYGYPQLAEYGTGAQRVTKVVTAPGAGVVAQSATYVDGFGRARIELTDATAVGQGGRRRDTAYTNRGKVLSQSLPYFDVAGATPALETFAYDSFDRVIKQTHADGTSRAYAYPIWTTKVVDEIGHTTSDAVDAHGRVVTHQESLNLPLTITRTYDLLGHLATVTDPLGNVSSYETDSLGRVYHKVDPDLGSWTFAFNYAGWETSRTDADGQTIATTYDKLGRVLTQGDRWMAYDEAGHGASLGRLTSMTNGPNGVALFTYDALGHRTLEQRSVGALMFFTYRAYDGAGRLLGVRYPDTDVVGCDPTQSCSGTKIGYDSGSRTISIPGILSAATYTAGGQLSTLTLANGAVTTYSYDPKRAFGTGIRTMGTSGPAIQDLGLTRDARGLVTGTASTDGVFPAWGWSYAIDELGRLTSATGPFLAQAFNYDALGDIIWIGSTTYDGLGHTTGSTATTYAYPAAGSPHPHAVSSTAGALASAYAYDANGNTTSGGGRSISWDMFNHPASVTMNGVTTSYAYDAAGARVTKQAAGAITYFLGDDYQTTTDATGTTSTKVVSLGDFPIAQRVSAGNVTATTWLHTDHLATVLATSDATGKVVSRAAYAPYGQPLQGSTSTAVSYTGERRDAESGLMYLHNRYYDTALARFVSGDPTVPGAGVMALNHYAYAGDSPTSFNDRTGLRPLHDDDSNEEQALADVRRRIDTLDQRITTEQQKLAGLKKAADDAWAARNANLPGELNFLDPNRFKFLQAAQAAQKAYDDAYNASPIPGLIAQRDELWHGYTVALFLHGLHRESSAANQVRQGWAFKIAAGTSAGLVLGPALGAAVIGGLTFGADMTNAKNDEDRAKAFEDAITVAANALMAGFSGSIASGNLKWSINPILNR